MTFDPTPRSDYEHWNEERDLVWYQEVGRHSHSEPSVYDDDDLAWTKVKEGLDGR